VNALPIFGAGAAVRVGVDVFVRAVSRSAFFHARIFDSGGDFLLGAFAAAAARAVKDLAELPIEVI
jgi:hypothetical protein